jgi:hypothetical protein
MTQDLGARATRVRCNPAMPVPTRIQPERWIRLALVLDVDEFGGDDAPALTLAATLVDLAVLYDLAGKAWRYDCPLVGLLAELRAPDLSLPSALETPRDLGAYAWSAARMVPLLGREIPPVDPDKLAQLQEQFSLHQTTSFMMVERVSIGPPLGLEVNLPWEDFGEEAGGWVFVDALEQQFAGRGAVRVASELAELRQAARADEARQGLELLSRDTAGVRLRSGELTVERHTEH